MAVERPPTTATTFWSPWLNLMQHGHNALDDCTCERLRHHSRGEKVLVGGSCRPLIFQEGVEKDEELDVTPAVSHTLSVTRTAEGESIFCSVVRAFPPRVLSLRHALIPCRLPFNSFAFIQ